MNNGVTPRSSDTRQPGLLIVNADDWGRDALTTNRILDCSLGGAISRVSAMAFMQDSDRAAALARERSIDTGLHLNFTTPFSASGCAPALLEHHERVARHLLRHRLAQVVFHPGLMRSFEYLVSAQIDEYRRIYGVDPERFDGHHHMHVCANVLFQHLLPAGTAVRGTYSFERGEKSIWNRLYRRDVNRRLASRHQLDDFTFTLKLAEPASRLQRIFGLARQFVVELQVHPYEPDEYQYLQGGEIFRQVGDLRIARPPILTHGRTAGGDRS
jgi:hypothetical protein